MFLAALFVGGFYGYFFPKTITWDSYLYLVSSQKLFSSEFLSWFHWLREPFYPVFLRIFYVNGLFDLNLIGLFQGMLHATGLFLIFYCFYQLNFFKTFVAKFLILLTLLISILITINYSTYILQQSLIVFFMGLFVILLYSIYINRGFSTFSFFLSLVLIFLTSSFTILLLPIPLIIIFIGLFISNRLNLRHLALIIFALLAFNLPWNIIKYQTVTSNISKYPEGLSSFIFLKSDLSLSEDQNKVKSKIQLTGAGVLSTLGISDELSGVTFTGGIAGEHFLFASPLKLNDRPCALLYPGPDIYVNEFNNKFQNTCHQLPLFKFFEQLNSFVQIFSPIFNFFAFILVVYFSLRKNLMVLVLWIPPFLSQVPYWIGGYYGSRYGLPVIAITPLMLLYALFKVYSKLQNKYHDYKKLKIT